MSETPSPEIAVTPPRIPYAPLQQVDGRSRDASEKIDDKLWCVTACQDISTVRRTNGKQQAGTST